jgi:uncharacterized protein YprB with RNaseH-like and TPR domain
MNPLADRLSRVAALRPARASNLPAVPSSNSEHLMRLLNAEAAFNRLGGHIRVRSLFSQPEAKKLCSNALRLLVPEGANIGDFNKWLFLDTETTGLAGGTGTYAFLVGLAWWERDGFVVEQHFMRDHGEEPSLLMEIADRLSHGCALVTFNGKSFDWPLLKTRFQISRMPAIPEPLFHLDLLYPARQLWKITLKSVALSQLEKHVLNFDRGPDIPSETIPQRYFDFLRGGEAKPIAEVFRHNQMDLCGLAFLALHIDSILSDPENNTCGPGELFGISRLLQNRGEANLAGRIYRKALAGGLPPSAKQIAQRELAALAKRASDYELSNALLEQLLGDTVVGLRAYEQLAIYYEHQGGQLLKAAELSREALIKLHGGFHSGLISSSKYRQWHDRFHHRLKRLSAKTAKT